MTTHMYTRFVRIMTLDSHSYIKGINTQKFNTQNFIEFGLSCQIGCVLNRCGLTHMSKLLNRHQTFNLKDV